MLPLHFGVDRFEAYLWSEGEITRKFYSSALEQIAAYMYMLGRYT